MEFCTSNTTRLQGRKNTIKKGTINSNNNLHNFVFLYSKDQLKMVALLGLIRTFQQNRQLILSDYQIQAQKKLNKTGIHFNKISSTLTIQPVKKQIVNIRIASKEIQKIKKGIINYFSLFTKRENQKKIISLSGLNSLQSSLEASLNFFQSIPFPQNSINNFIASGIKTPVILPKQNKEIRKSLHKRNLSDLMLFSKRQSPLKQISNKRRQQLLFISKKKEQMNFLRKITVQFSSQQAQFKALIQIMQLFLKNLTRSVYFLKTIDQNEKKYEKIMVCIRQLNRLLQNILQILEKVSKLHKSLEINFNNAKVKAQFAHIPPQIQKLYDKSNQITLIMRQYLLSATFVIVMKPQRSECSKLITLLAESRYTLRYLQKSIQNLQIIKKQFGKMSSWQKAFRVKFIGKNTLC